MREEDLDWFVYRSIPENGGTTTENLMTITGFESSAVIASLERLERYLLIRRSGENVRLLSIQESLIECQCRYSEDLPFTIEDGVIKAKRREG